MPIPSAGENLVARMTAPSPGRQCTDQRYGFVLINPVAGGKRGLGATDGVPEGERPPSENGRLRALFEAGARRGSPVTSAWSTPADRAGSDGAPSARRSHPAIDSGAYPRDRVVRLVDPRLADDVEQRGMVGAYGASTIRPSGLEGSSSRHATVRPRRRGPRRSRRSLPCWQLFPCLLFCLLNSLRPKAARRRRLSSEARQRLIAVFGTAADTKYRNGGSVKVEGRL